MLHKVCTKLMSHDRYLFPPMPHDRNSELKYQIPPRSPLILTNSRPPYWNLADGKQATGKGGNNTEPSVRPCSIYCTAESEVSGHTKKQKQKRP